MLVLASLYIAGENLDKAVVMARARSEGMTPEAYANTQGGLSVRKLQAKLRPEVIFQGDDTAYELAKDAVDGFEHGSMDLGEVHRRAEEACPKVFRYVRAAIVDMLGLTQVIGRTPAR